MNMDFNHPSIPATEAALDTLSLQDSIYPDQPPNGSSNSSTKNKELPPVNGCLSVFKAILESGDIIIEYSDPEIVATSPAKSVLHSWRVSSNDLMRNSPYFRALLDPHKFLEGKNFMSQKIQAQQLTSESPAEGVSLGDKQVSNSHELPIVRLPNNHFSSRLGIDAVELFLEVLSFDSFKEEHQSAFSARLKVQPISLVARLVELADAFNSPQAIKTALKQSGYAFGKGKFPLTKFDSSLLKLAEDRIRQTIFVARCLDEHAIFQVYTHTLVVLGSKYWTNGVEAHETPTFPWRYFTGGIEEELYFRRQCVLNTITDLQAHFLRVYGALEGQDEATAVATSTSASSSSTTSTSTNSQPPPRPPFSLPATSTTLHPRHFQCRYGFANSSACDAFHLGQMTRFFALRTKTIFLGSTLIDDPDFLLVLDDENDGSETDQANSPNQHHNPPSPQTQQHQQQQQQQPTNIIALLASLKQCPDYQIDANHTGCGIRRRFLPPLDCIERFVGDGRGLLGVDLLSSRWDAAQWPLAAGSWANRARPRALVLDVHLSRINAIPVMARPGFGGGGRAERAARVGSSQEENARLLFTARRRNWEA